MNQPSTGGWHGSSRRETGLSPGFKCQSAQYHKRTQKFGIEFPKTVDEAYATNKATGTTLWRDAKELEMKNVRVAFDVLPDGVAPPSDHQYMKCHMIFDVKMEDFHRKARLLAGGHMTKAPALSLIPALCPGNLCTQSCL